MMSDQIRSLEPAALWQHFADLNAIPRPSKKEEKVREFMLAFGKKLGLETLSDSTGNVLIRKPASPGMENRQPVILQAHLDMVHQKNADTDFDFETQGIDMVVEAGWVKARGTTLGADNGIGVAAIMAVLSSNQLIHPPVEALFTIDEETGMTGAKGLEGGWLKGNVLLNLDTEEDDELDIGCAGGLDFTASKEYSTSAVQGEGISIEIKGLTGGHSGMDIDKGRGNANVILGRFLFAGIGEQIQLVSIDAGGLRNAIPREAKASFIVANTDEYLKNAEALKADILNEFKTVEKDLNISITKTQVSGQGISTEESTAFVKGLKAAHNGVYRMSPDVEGLVESSNNIARVELKEGKLKVLNLSRSSVDSTKQAVTEQLRASFELAGLEVVFTGSYPGWQPNPSSEIVSILERIYTQKFGEEPRVVACHAGLECGIIGSNYPKMEMVSFGPHITGAHSPEEKVNIKSVQKFWGYLQDILKEIPKK